MRRTMLVILALLLCAGTGWSITDSGSQETNSRLWAQMWRAWGEYFDAAQGVHMGGAGSWRKLVVAKAALQKAIKTARTKADRHDSVSARGLDEVRDTVEKSFEDMELDLYDDIMGHGRRPIAPERKE